MVEACIAHPRSWVQSLDHYKKKPVYLRWSLSLALLENPVGILLRIPPGPVVRELLKSDPR